MTEPPAWATEPVEVVDWDPAWSARARRLRADLERRLAPWLDGRVEHVGSTAVPGLPAKPVIDLAAPVASLDRAPAADDALRQGGWHLVPTELDRRPWRRFFVLPEGATRVAHLHVTQRNGDRWHQMLVFRDALIQRPDRARAYAALKRDLALRHSDDREAYTLGKTEFIEEVLRGSR